LTHLACLLNPFLNALANTDSKQLQDRIKENIFHPLLESNVTPDSDSEDSEEEKLHEVDGGKMSKKTRKEVRVLIN